MRRTVLEGAVRARVEAGLPLLLKAQRWFGGKARDLTAAHIIDSIPIPYGDGGTGLLLIGVAYADGEREIYLLPIASAFGAQAGRISHDLPGAVLVHVAADDTKGREPGVLYDAMWDSAVLHVLVRAMEQGARFAGQRGDLQASSTPAYKAMVPSDDPVRSRLLSTEQSNTTVAFGQEAVLKLYRRVQAGINPDWEIGRYLTTHGFSHSPAVGGAIEYVTPSERTTVALLQSYVRNEGDAWTEALKQLDGFLVRAIGGSRGESNAGQDRSLWDLALSPVPDAARQLIGPALDAARCLARRTAALHRTLGQAQDDPDFTPEPMTVEHRQARHQSMSHMWKQVSRLLAQRSFTAPAMRQEAERLLAHESTVLAVFETLVAMREGGRRIRCHGDYHLGQVLWTGSDYVVTDFEGEPARPLQERRVKQSPLYDVAGMLRSFDYASWTALGNRPPNNDQRDLEPWARYWSRWVRACFLREYLAEMNEAGLLPPSHNDAARLLTVYQLEKAVYELGYELNNRPDWVAIPMKGINEIAHESGAKTAA